MAKNPRKDQAAAEVRTTVDLSPIPEDAWNEIRALAMQMQKSRQFGPCYFKATVAAFLHIYDLQISTELTDAVDDGKRH